MQCVRGWRAWLVLSVVCLVAGGAPVWAAETALVSKVVISDGSYRAITNTGTIRAVNRLAGIDNIPADVQLLAATEVLLGANEAGFLEPVQLVPGDQFFAKSATADELIIVTFTGAEFVLPGQNAGFATLSLPPG